MDVLFNWWQQPMAVLLRKVIYIIYSTTPKNNNYWVSITMDYYHNCTSIFRSLLLSYCHHLLGQSTSSERKLYNSHTLPCLSDGALGHQRIKECASTYCYCSCVQQHEKLIEDFQSWVFLLCLLDLKYDKAFDKPATLRKSFFLLHQNLKLSNWYQYLKSALA